MAVLDSLPTELFALIVSRIDSQRDLVALSRCSKTINDLLTPLLYANVYLCTRSEQRRTSHDHSWCNPKPEPFIRLLKLACTLQRSPEHATHVKYLTYRAFETFDSRQLFLLGCYQLTKRCAELVPAIEAQASSAEHARRWISSICYPAEDDSVLALILPQLANLISLDITKESYTDNLSHALSSIVDQHLPFSLQDIVISASASSKHPVMLDDLEMWLRLDSIRRLYAYRVTTMWRPKTMLASYQTAYSNITHIELRDSYLQGFEVARLLAAPRALQTFIYERRWDYLGRGPNESEPMQQVHEALGGHKQSLR